MTSVLIDEPARAPEFGLDPNLSFLTQFSDCTYSHECSHQVGAKTGTTDKEVNGVDYAEDNWTMGYTPDIVVGVWSGNADGTPLAPNTLGITGAAPIWQDIIAAASGYCTQALDLYGLLPCPNITPQSLGIDTETQFPIPSDVYKVSLNTYNGLAGAGNADYVIAGMVPSSSGLQPQSGGNPNGNNGNNGNNRNNGPPIPGPGGHH
jgi:membrane peptidoglycan carboxypeptidase